MESTGEDIYSVIARISSWDASLRSVPPRKEKRQDGERRSIAGRRIREGICGSADADSVNLSDASQVTTTGCVGTRRNSNDYQNEIQERGPSPKETPSSSCNVEGEEAKRSTSHVTDTCASRRSELLDEEASESITMSMLHKIRQNVPFKVREKRKYNGGKYISLPSEESDLKITLKRKSEFPDSSTSSKKMKRDKNGMSLSSSDTKVSSEDEEKGDKREDDKAESERTQNRQATVPAKITPQNGASAIPAVTENFENSLAYFAADDRDTDSTPSCTNKPIIEENIERNKDREIDIFVDKADQGYVIQSSQGQRENQGSSNVDSTNNVEKQSDVENSGEMLSFTEETRIEKNMKPQQEKEIAIIFLNETSQNQNSSSESPTISTEELIKVLTESCDVQNNNINSCAKSRTRETLTARDNSVTKDVMKTVIGNHPPATTPESGHSSRDKCTDNETSPSVTVANSPSDSCANESPTADCDDDKIELELQVKSKAYPQATPTFSMKACLGSLNTCLETLGKFINKPESLFELLKRNSDSNTNAEQSKEQQDTPTTGKNSSESSNPACETLDSEQQSAKSRPNGNENTTNGRNTNCPKNIKVRSWQELRHSTSSSTSQLIEPDIYEVTSSPQASSQVTEPSSSRTERDVIPHTLDSFKKQFAEIKIMMRNIIIQLHHIRSIVNDATRDNFPSERQVQKLKKTMTKMNANIYKLRKALHMRSYTSVLEFLHSCTDVPVLTVDEYLKLTAVTERCFQYYNLPKGTYLNISHSTDDISYNYNLRHNNTQTGSQGAPRVSSSDTRTSNPASSQSSNSSSLSGVGFQPYSRNSSFQYMSYSRQCASSSCNLPKGTYLNISHLTDDISHNYNLRHNNTQMGSQGAPRVSSSDTRTSNPASSQSSSSFLLSSVGFQQQLADNNNYVRPLSHPITLPLSTRNANHVRPPSYPDGATLMSGVQRANTVPLPSHTNRVISMSIAHQVPPSNVTYISKALTSNIINMSGSTCQTNASLDMRMPQIGSEAQIVLPNVMSILPITQQSKTQQQQNAVNASRNMYLNILRNQLIQTQQQNSVSFNIQQHSWRDPSVPLANSSMYQQNLANSSAQHRTFANLSTREYDAGSAFTRLQQLRNARQQNRANLSAQQQMLANRSVPRQNLQQNSCHADCADCAKFSRNISNFQNIRTSKILAHANGLASTVRSDAMNDPVTNAPNSTLDDRVEISTFQNKTYTLNKTPRQDVRQELTETQNLSQRSSTQTNRNEQTAQQTSTSSQRPKGSQNTPCDTPSGKDQTRALILQERVKVDKFDPNLDLDLDFLTDIQKFVLCEQLKSNYDILVWIRKNAPSSISEKLDETAIQWSLVLHKYMRERTNEILRDFCSDNQSRDSPTPVPDTSVRASPTSEKTVETSTAGHSPEHSYSRVVAKDDTFASSDESEAIGLDMPEIDVDSDDGSEISCNDTRNNENIRETSKTVATSTQNEDNDSARFSRDKIEDRGERADNTSDDIREACDDKQTSNTSQFRPRSKNNNSARFSRDNEDRGERADNTSDDIREACDDKQTSNTSQSRPRSRSIISYAPRASTPVAESSEKLSSSLNKCTGPSRACVHCKHIAEIVKLCLDIEDNNKNEKASSVTSSHGTSDEGCDRLVIDEQSTICSEEDNHVSSDATLSQTRVSENDAEADSCRAATANEARDTSSASRCSVGSVETVTSAGDATEKSENVDTHSGVKNINKLFERMIVYKRHAIPRIYTRELRVQLERVNVRRDTSKENGTLNSECVSSTDRDATLQSPSGAESRDKEESEDNCETSEEEKSDDEACDASREDNDELTSSDTCDSDCFDDCEMISDKEDGIPPAESGITLYSSTVANVKDDIFEVEDAPNDECIPKTKENTTLQFAVAEENQNEKEYKGKREILGDKTFGTSGESTAGTGLRTNCTDNERDSDGTKHRDLSLKTEDDIALQSCKSEIAKEIFVKGEDVPDDAHKSKYVSVIERNVTMQSSSIVENQTERESKDNREVSAEKSDTRKDSYEVIIINESRTPCSGEASANNSEEDDVVLLKELQFENNILSPEATFQAEDALNNKLVHDAERDATSQFHTGSRIKKRGEQNKKEQSNNDCDISSKNSDETTRSTESTSVSNSAVPSNNSGKNPETSELNVTESPYGFSENNEVETVPTILKVETIPESVFNKMNINYANEIAQNNAGEKVVGDDANEISQNRNVDEQNATNIVNVDNDTESGNEHIPCLRCKRASTIYCQGCMSASYCTKRCSVLHWKSSHHKICTRK